MYPAALARLCSVGREEDLVNVVGKQRSHPSTSVRALNDELVPASRGLWVPYCGVEHSQICRVWKGKRLIWVSRGQSAAEKESRR